MTQTIRKVIHKKDSATVDIYYHPNDASAKIMDAKARYRYSVNIVKLTLGEALEYHLEELKYEDDQVRRKNLAEEIKVIIAISKNNVIWRVQAGYGIDNLGICFEDEYHSTKAAALGVAQSLYC